MTTRRGFITGLISLVAAPAIIRAGSLMPVKQMLATPERNLVVLNSVSVNGCTSLIGPAWYIVTGKDEYGRDKVERLIVGESAGHILWQTIDNITIQS